MLIGALEKDGGQCNLEAFPYCCGVHIICHYTVKDPGLFWPYLMKFMQGYAPDSIWVIADRVESYSHDTGTMKEFVRYLRELTTWEIMETPPRLSHPEPGWTLVQGWFILPTWELKTQDKALFKAYNDILSTRV